jgi:hypothetical protein
MKKITKKQLTQIIKEVYKANFDSWADTEGLETMKSSPYKLCYKLHVSPEAFKSEDLEGALKENGIGHLYNTINSPFETTGIPGLLDYCFQYGIGYYSGAHNDNWYEPPLLYITFWFDNIETPNQIIEELGMDTYLLTEEDEL